MIPSASNSKHHAVSGLCPYALLIASYAKAAVFTPDDLKIQYTGRIDMRTPAAPIFGWPGGKIRANFDGTYAKVTLTNQNDGDGNTFWAAIIDDAPPP